MTTSSEHLKQADNHESTQPQLLDPDKLVEPPSHGRVRTRETVPCPISRAMDL